MATSSDVHKKDGGEGTPFYGLRSDDDDDDDDDGWWWYENTSHA